MARYVEGIGAVDHVLIICDRDADPFAASGCRTSRSTEYGPVTTLDWRPDLALPPRKTWGP